MDVFSEDWDALVVLDARRYDMSERVHNLNGILSARQSKESATTEWLNANFDSRDLTDTVYVTGNPQLERNRERWNTNLGKTINV